ncbi:HAD subfamily IIID h [Mycena indigotica]|uniref:protein-serine/threonine phosphatase n=1 Tax=Mycena indigotica TaxID=2126181 RepID=A0A8H6SAU7_9AGAR|nr:HAD subfamily IIID h [Mycena indigotica]KAF7295523.1 HAD subfamily IIID h [Mycena indigotica]
MSDSIPPSLPEPAPENWIELSFSWAGKPFSLSLAESDRVFDFKAALQNLTRVPPERQKILGLVKGNKTLADQERIGDLKLNKKFTLIGTPEGDEIKGATRHYTFVAFVPITIVQTHPAELENLPDIVNDFDLDLARDPVASAAYANDQRNQRKVKEATSALKVNIIHPLREKKKLLVLDIDYTILDTKPLTTGSLPPAECARPRLHEFLEAIYPYYDICIWSQTSWIWLETKLVELEMVGAHRNYQISFVLDKTPMFTVFSTRDNKPWQHSVKALQIIWNHFPQFNASNTIHVDDLSRNFALNPGQGLKISAFKGAATPQATADRELDKLARYMVHIANVDDFRTLHHENWKTVLRGLPES